jgi:5-methyltetrahydrofolate--homocysteine methyltransferase
MAANIETYLREGYVNIIGGCCGTTPAHIVAIAEKVKNFAPRKTKSDILFNTFSGLEPYYAVDNSIYINDPSNTNDREKFQKFITDGEYEDAADVARLMIDKGETVLNIEIDDEKALNAFLDYALMNPYVARVPFLISSLKMNVIEAGLKRLQGHGLAGPFSLINGDEELIQKIKLVHQYGASALITLVDEQGSFPEPDLLPEAIVAEINQRKNEIENRIKKLLEDNGLSVDTIVFDRDSCPNVNFAI